MNYNDVCEEFISKDLIYKEDVIALLDSIFKFSEKEVRCVINYIQNPYNREYLHSIMNILKAKPHLNEVFFLNFLERLTYRFIPCKLATSIIEKSFISLIDNLTECTNGYLVFETQMEILQQTIGRVFMWPSYPCERYAPREIKKFFITSMKDVKLQYPALMKKLLASVDYVELSKSEDFFVETYGSDKALFMLSRQRLREEASLKNAIHSIF